MTTGAIIWLIVGAISAAVFFGIAAVVTVLGIRDLRELLRGTLDITHLSE
jgi:hypothetical protein